MTDDDEAHWFYKNEGRADERAAVVAWLRRWDNGELLYASAIERGDHLNKPPEIIPGTSSVKGSENPTPSVDTDHFADLASANDPEAFRGPAQLQNGNITCDEDDEWYPRSGRLLSASPVINPAPSGEPPGIPAEPPGIRELPHGNPAPSKSFLAWARHVGGVPVSQMASAEPMPSTERSINDDCERCGESHPRCYGEGCPWCLAHGSRPSAGSCGCYMRKMPDGGLDQLVCAQHAAEHMRLVATSYDVKPDSTRMPECQHRNVTDLNGGGQRCLECNAEGDSIRMVERKGDE